MIPLFETLLLVVILFATLGLYLYNKWIKGIRQVIASQTTILGAILCFILSAVGLLAILLLSINPEPPCEWLLSDTNQSIDVNNHTLTAYEYNNSCSSGNFDIAETLYSILIAIFGMLIIVLTIIFAFEFINVVKKVFRRW